MVNDDDGIYCMQFLLCWFSVQNAGRNVLRHTSGHRSWSFTIAWEFNRFRPRQTIRYLANKYWSHTKVSNRYLTDVDTRVFIIWVNTWRPRRNRRHFAHDIFKCIFWNENVLIVIKISLKFNPKGPINIIPAMVQIMAWRRPGDKPLSEPTVVSLLTQICVTRPQ